LQQKKAEGKTKVRFRPALLPERRVDIALHGKQACGERAEKPDAIVEEGEEPTERTHYNFQK